MNPKPPRWAQVAEVQRLVELIPDCITMPEAMRKIGQHPNPPNRGPVARVSRAYQAGRVRLADLERAEVSALIRCLRAARRIGSLGRYLAGQA